jgi:hypothetical protein
MRIGGRRQRVAPATVEPKARTGGVPTTANGTGSP